METMTAEEYRNLAEHERAGRVAPKVDKKHAFLTEWRRLAPTWPEPIAELRFAKPRRYRLDYAFEAERVCVEVDGGQWAPNGGRHARDSDREKHNEATSRGWAVFHVSPQMLKADPYTVVDQVKRALALRRAEVSD